VSVHEAKTQLSKLLQRVMNGDEVVIMKAGCPVARLVPYHPVTEKRMPGSDAGKVIIGPDFDEPLPEYGDI
jgi:prevent-host-death family protein